MAGVVGVVFTGVELVVESLIGEISSLGGVIVSLNR